MPSGFFVPGRLWARWGVRGRGRGGARSRGRLRARKGLSAMDLLSVSDFLSELRKRGVQSTATVAGNGCCYVKANRLIGLGFGLVRGRFEETGLELCERARTRATVLGLEENEEEVFVSVPFAGSVRVDGSGNFVCEPSASGRCRTVL